MSHHSVAPAGAEPPGFFGKWPSHGDFVSRRLPQEFLERWDQWLQDGLRASQAQLKSAWLDTYLTSPIWNFAICGGICGLHPWCGVAMPSVDRVGRYFPLMLAAPLPLDANLPKLLEADAWFTAARDTLLRVLADESYTLTAFDNDVARLGPALPYDSHIYGRSGAGFGDAWQIPLLGPARACTAGVMHQLLLHRCGQYSLWWGEGSQQVTPSLLVCRDLPTPLQFTALLDGSWSSSNWSSWGTGAGSN